MKDRTYIKSITTKTAEFKLDSEGIIHIKPFEGIEIELMHAKENHEAMLKINNNQPALMMIHTKGTISATPEARAYSASSEVSSCRIAQAIVVDSFLNKLASNFYINFNKPKNPTRIFNSVQEAHLWLKKHEEQSVFQEIEAETHI